MESSVTDFGLSSEALGCTLMLLSSHFTSDIVCSFDNDQLTVLVLISVGNRRCGNEKRGNRGGVD